MEELVEGYRMVVHLLTPVTATSTATLVMFVRLNAFINIASFY